MKDNPVQRLDLLEAQLSRIESKDSDSVGKLARTKHLLERLEKSGALETDASKLRAEIKAVKQEIVQRKLFYAANVIKRCLKQFKKVEPLRIAKRLKAADSPAKKEMLEAELALVNEADAEQWASDIAYRGLAKRFDVLAVTGTAYSKRALNTAEINVFSRLGKNEAVHTAILKLVENVSEHFEPTQVTNTSTAANTGSTTNTNKSASTSTNSGDGKATDTGSQGSATGLATGSNDDFTEFPEEAEEAVEEAAEKAPEEAPEEAASGGEVDPFFAPVVDDDSELPLGLPMLQQGYISGSDDESGPEPEPEPEPTRRNRRGQRARRKIWEQKFGKRANHILKQEREEQKEREAKENRKRRREEKLASVKRQKIELAAKPLHPSWEAHQKEKERVKQAKFAGKKMRFD